VAYTFDRGWRVYRSAESEVGQACGEAFNLL